MRPIVATRAARFVALASVCLAVFVGGPPPLGANDYRPVGEHEVKALYVFNFLRLVEWPRAETDTLTPLRIGLLHEDPFAGYLHQVVRGRKVHSREILVEVCGLADVDSIHYDVIFMSATEMRYATTLLKQTRDAPVLTVGEGEGFLQSGGLINLVRVGATVKFDVSLAAAERTGLTLGSGLLRVARRVLRKD